jgi:predicted transcriptional regulator
VSDDSEAGVLSNLKQACGYEYTTKLQRMFSDMMQGEEVNAKFQEFATASKGAVSTEGVAFSVFVLTQGSWPLQVHKSAFNAPEEFLCCQRAFGKYYDSVHQGRRLVWLHHLGKADVRVTFLKKKYLVTVTDFQCGLMLLLNDRETPVSWEELLAKSAMAEGEVEKTMGSLVASKLIKRVGEQAEKDGPGAHYDVNKSYQNKHLKFKITAAVQGETDKDKKKTYKQVDDDRTMFLQALIVRIMKARKKLNHNALMQEVIAQAASRFQPSVSLIKKQIEALIEKEFLERQEGATAEYLYVS